MLHRLIQRIKNVSSYGKPRILLLADRRNWAHDHNARQLIRWLRRDFSFDLRYVWESPEIDPTDFDLIYVFFWGENYHRRFPVDPERTIKGVSSHRWEDDPQYGPCSAAKMTAKYLYDAALVVCPSQRLYDTFRGVHPRVYLAPKGYDPSKFKHLRKRTGPMTIGWAGNIRDSVKRFHEILEPACHDRFQLLKASGDTTHGKMNQFYNRLDVFAVASKHEGDPLTLIEAMAAGCFPVCTDVGIVPELVRPGGNGLIVDGTPQAFRAAFEWCETHMEQVRKMGEMNAARIPEERRWELMVAGYKRAFSDALAHAQRPRFRNDDVSWDSALDRLRDFCAIFHNHGFTQLHGINLYGRTSTLFRFGGEAVAYENTPSISKLPYAQICELSEAFRFEERHDLIEFLQDSPDDIALHGLYHTDYSAMTAEEQRRDLSTGLAILCQLFPRKLIRYFIAPFNRTNPDTYRVCSELGLVVLAADGIHLEEELAHLTLRPGVWHRYHHHRFYPENVFTCYKLSLELLRAALARNRSSNPGSSEPGTMQ